MGIDGLKRVLGLTEVSFIAIGMTVGAGVFVFTGIVLKIAGPALPLAFALAVIPVFLSMLPLAMLGSALPSTGGNYRYPSRMVSPGLTFTGVWVYALATFFGQIPLYSLACARYARVLFPEVHIELFAIILVTFFYVVNLFGVKIAAQVQGIMVVVLIGALAYFSASGIANLHAENFNDFFRMGAGNIVLGIALLTFTYLGSNGIIELGDEIKNPGRTIPRAFFIAFPVVTVLYLLVAVSAVGVVPCERLASVDEPLVMACRGMMGASGVMFFVLGGAILALTTTLNALFIFGTKSLLVIVGDDILPKWMGRINARFGTPHILLTIIWIFSLAGILSGFSLETFASYAALGGMVIFIPVLLASIILPRRYPERYARSQFKLRGFWLWFCPIVGFVMILFFSVVIIADLKSWFRIFFFLLFILTGIVYYLLRKRYLLRKGVRLEDIKKREDWTTEGV